jgi:polyhydroxyalkanoate synthase subunit PhaC
MAAKKDEDTARSEQPDELAVSASEGMLGPNPFVGLRPRDILATAQQIGAQALRQPALLMEQEAALARDLMAVLGGSADCAPPQGDKRADRVCRSFRARSEKQGTRAVRAVAVH